MKKKRMTIRHTAKTASQAFCFFFGYMPNKEKGTEYFTFEIDQKNELST
jgi:hypothetical protein